MLLPIASGSQPMRRLALTLVLALLLHGLALYCLPQYPRHFLALAQRHTRLKVVLLPMTPSPAADFQDARREVATTGTVAPPMRRAESPPLPGKNEQSAQAPLQERQPAPSAAQLRDAARWMARQEAGDHQERSAAEEGDSAADNTVEARLARALSLPRAGEKRLSDGLIKITTILGTSYCLKTPPDSLRGGPVDPVSIPMTCP